MESEGLFDRFLHFLRENILVLVLGFIGLLFLGYGLIHFFIPQQPEGEITIEENTQEEKHDSTITIDVSGAVKMPGVYELEADSRITDAIQKAGGMSDDADHAYVAKAINLAQILTDGMKVYIPRISDVMSSSVLASDTGKTSINSATSKELEDLPGIGPVTAEKIISNRPYAALDELLSKKVVGASVFEKIKEQISL